MTEAQEAKMSSFDNSENLRLDKSLTPTTLALNKMVLKASQRENILPMENGATTKSPIKNNSKLKVPPKTPSDEDVEWCERTEVLTKVDHEEHIALAGEVISGLLNSLPVESPDKCDTVSEQSYVSVTSEINVSSCSYQTAVDYQQLDSELDSSDLSDIATPFARNSSPNCFIESHSDELNCSSTPVARIPLPALCPQTPEGTYSELDSIVGHLERLNLNATFGYSSSETVISDDKDKGDDSDFDSKLCASHIVNTSFDVANSSYDIIELPLPDNPLSTHLVVTEPTVEGPAAVVEINKCPTLKTNGSELPTDLEANDHSEPANLDFVRNEISAILDSNTCGINADVEANNEEVTFSLDTEYKVAVSLETSKNEIPPEINDCEFLAPPVSDNCEVTAFEAYEGAVTAPEADESSVAVPEVDESSVTAPEVDESSVAAPEVDESSVAAPEVDESAVAAPEVDESAVAAPEVDESAVAAPEVDESAVAASEANESVVTASEANESAVAASEANESVVTASKPDISAVAASEVDEFQVPVLQLCNDTIENGNAAIPESLETNELSEQISATAIQHTDSESLVHDHEATLPESKEVCIEDTDNTAVLAFVKASGCDASTQEAYGHFNNSSAQGDIEINNPTAETPSLEESSVQTASPQEASEISFPVFHEHKEAEVILDDCHADFPASLVTEECTSIVIDVHQASETSQQSFDTAISTSQECDKPTVESIKSSCEPVISAHQEVLEPAVPSEEASKTSRTLHDLCETTVSAASVTLIVPVVPISLEPEYVAQTDVILIDTVDVPTTLETSDLVSRESFIATDSSAHGFQPVEAVAPAYPEHIEHSVETDLNTDSPVFLEPLVNKSADPLPEELYESAVLDSSNITVLESKEPDENIVPGFASTENSLTTAAVVSEEANGLSAPIAYEFSESTDPSTLESDAFIQQTQDINELAASSVAACGPTASSEFEASRPSNSVSFEASDSCASTVFESKEHSAPTAFESSEPSAFTAFQANEPAAVEVPREEQGKSAQSFDFLDKLFEYSGAFEDDISRIIGLLGANNSTAPMPSADSQTMADAQNNTVMEPSQRPDLDNNDDPLDSRPSPEIAAKATLVDNANGLSPETALSPQDNAIRSDSNHVQSEHVFKSPQPHTTGPSPVSDAADSPIQPCLLDSTMSLDSGIDDLNNTKQRNGTSAGEGVATDSKGMTQATVNFSEAGPDVADCRQEEFKSATDFFMDPKGLDFLEKHHGKQDVDSALARMSLYVKFDPCLPERARVVNQWLSTCGQPETANEKEVSSPHRTTSANLPLADNLKLIDLSHSPHEVQREETPLQSSPAAGVATATAENSVLPDQEVRRMLAVQELLFQERLLMKDVEYDKKVKQLEKENIHLRSQVQEVRQSQSEMTQVVCEYEKTLTQLIADSDRQKQLAALSEQQLTKDRDQALEDMQNVELAFGDLHRRYEKLKLAVEGFKKNEDTLTKCLTDFQETIKSQNERYEMLKLRAEERLESASVEIDNARKNSESEIAALRAQLKIAEMRIDGLERALEQKGKENSELTNICDELIAQVGKST